MKKMEKKNLARCVYVFICAFYITSQRIIFNCLYCMNLECTNLVILVGWQFRGIAKIVKKTHFFIHTFYSFLLQNCEKFINDATFYNFVVKKNLWIKYASRVNEVSIIRNLTETFFLWQELSPDVREIVAAAAKILF